MSEYISPKATPLDLSEMPESALQPEYREPKFMRMCGIRFGEFGRVFDFNCQDISLELDDYVIAEVPEKGLMAGRVAKPPFKIDITDLKLRLPTILRAADDEDQSKIDSLRKAEELAFETVESWITRLKLDMRLLRVEYTYDRHKVMIYFASENRVDFRELLRELIRDLQSRVELRQVGVRDQARDRGAIGPCGEETCCSRFINKFSAVSIKMARDQGLSLTPTKVSGNCGRLKCCLAYEHAIYQTQMRNMPRKGKCVKCKSSGACGVVRDVNVLKEEVLVQFDDGSSQMMKASELIEDRGRHRNEKVVATTDKDALVSQINQARSRPERGQSERGEDSADSSATDSEKTDHSSNNEKSAERRADGAKADGSDGDRPRGDKKRGRHRNRNRKKKENSGESVD